MVRARLSTGQPNPKPFADFDETFRQRIAEADAYYADLQSNIPDADVRRVQRQAFAGMLWSKQYYYYDIREWLDGDPGQPVPPKSRHYGRNSDWFHLYAADVIAMPDKWEYPWFAAWDWAFHLVTLALIDPRFAKDQLMLLCQVSLQGLHLVSRVLRRGQRPRARRLASDGLDRSHRQPDRRVVRGQSLTKREKDLGFGDRWEAQ